MDALLGTLTRPSERLIKHITNTLLLQTPSQFVEPFLTLIDSTIVKQSNTKEIVRYAFLIDYLLSQQHAVVKQHYSQAQLQFIVDIMKAKVSPWDVATIATIQSLNQKWTGVNGGATPIRFDYAVWEHATIPHCDLCKERLTTSYDQENEAWWCPDGVYVNGYIRHKRCDVYTK